jgi:hypothetical protein
VIRTMRGMRCMIPGIRRIEGLDIGVTLSLEISDVLEPEVNNEQP